MDTFINNQEFNGDEEDDDSPEAQLVLQRSLMQVNSQLKTNDNQIVDDEIDGDEYAMMRLQE